MCQGTVHTPVLGVRVLCTPVCMSRVEVEGEGTVLLHVHILVTVFRLTDGQLNQSFTYDC
jgi:hypothetical protein